MKKMYKHPQTDVLKLKTEELLQGLNPISPGANASSQSGDIDAD